MNIPSIMPVLSAGAHRGPEDGACVMEMVSYLAGEEWSDTPSCTFYPLARAAQKVNDVLSDEDRHLLVPLIGRLFGTDIPVDDRAFALRVAQTVEHLSPEAKACNDVTGRYLVGEATVEELAAARDATYGVSGWAAWAASRAADDAGYAATADDADNITGAAAVAAAYAYVAYAAAVNAADAYVVYTATTTAADSVTWLASVINIYDELSGRTEHREVTAEELKWLAGAVKG